MLMGRSDDDETTLLVLGKPARRQRRPVGIGSLGPGAVLSCDRSSRGERNAAITSFEAAVTVDVWIETTRRGENRDERVLAGQASASVEGRLSGVLWGWLVDLSIAFRSREEVGMFGGKSEVALTHTELLLQNEQAQTQVMG